jgi:hypothetical protein
MNANVREMIKEALQSEGVEEIFKLGEEAETEQDIFDEDYLAKIEKIKLYYKSIFANAIFQTRGIPTADQ